jgi:SAM-dependent methyltransferase
VYVGIDRSAAELAAARRTCPEHRFLLADAVDPPLPDGQAAAVLSSFALQILQPLDEVLAAAARLLRPNGVLTFTLPAGGALGVRDRLRWARLALALRSSLGFPNDAALRTPGSLLEAADLVLVEDVQRRFALPLRGGADADALIDSLYLPDVTPAALDRGRAVARSWIGGEIGIAVRRLVAVRGRTVV